MTDDLCHVLRWHCDDTNISLTTNPAASLLLARTPSAGHDHKTYDLTLDPCNGFDDPERVSEQFPDLPTVSSEECSDSDFEGGLKSKKVGGGRKAKRGTPGRKRGRAGVEKVAGDKEEQKNGPGTLNRSRVRLLGESVLCSVMSSMSLFSSCCAPPRPAPPFHCTYLCWTRMFTSFLT